MTSNNPEGRKNEPSPEALESKKGEGRPPSSTTVGSGPAVLQPGTVTAAAIAIVSGAVGIYTGYTGLLARVSRNNTWIVPAALVLALLAVVVAALADQLQKRTKRGLLFFVAGSVALAAVAVGIISIGRGTTRHRRPPENHWQVGHGRSTTHTAGQRFRPGSQGRRQNVYRRRTTLEQRRGRAHS